MFEKTWFKVIAGLLSLLFLMFFWAFALGLMDVDGNWTFMPLMAFVLSLATYAFIKFSVQYNRVVHLKAEIGSSFNAIAIKANHMDSLISQLREVTDRIVDHELKMSIKKTYSELVDEEKSSDHQTSDSSQSHHQYHKKKDSNQSGSVGSHDHISQVSDKVTKLVERLERDTDGRADQSLTQLMAEIKEAQAILTNQRLYHNDTVANYNRAIYALPLAFL